MEKLINVRGVEMAQPFDFNAIAKMLSPAEKEVIRLTHIQLDRLIKSTDFILDKKDELPPDTVKWLIERYVKAVSDLECDLQRMWGVPVDKNYHAHWLRSRFCSCPRMDNLDSMNFGRARIISGDCILHGGFPNSN